MVSVPALSIAPPSPPAVLLLLMRTSLSRSVPRLRMAPPVSAPLACPSKICRRVSSTVAPGAMSKPQQPPRTDDVVAPTPAITRSAVIAKSASRVVAVRQQNSVRAGAGRAGVHGAVGVGGADGFAQRAVAVAVELVGGGGDGG